MSTNFKLSKAGLLRRSIAAAALMTTASGGLYAEGLEEIVVTAQRRAESIQDVPLAVSAFTGEFLKETNLDDVKDLVLYTPGITGNSHDSFIDTLSIRGIITNDFGVGGDPSVSIFKNNLYQGRNGAVVTSLYDIERAEVLRGPQGFLFGRNAIAGGISVITKKPGFDGPDGYLEADVAEGNHLTLEGATNIAVSDEFAIRLAGYKSREDGYVKNYGKPGSDDLIAFDKTGFRLSARAQSEKTEVNFTAEYEDREQSGSVYRATGMGDSFEALQEVFPDFVMRGGKGDIDSDQGLGEADDAKILSLGLQIDWDLEWATLTSLTGYRDHDYYYAEDFDGTPLHINDYRQDQEGNYFETELRLVSETDSPLSWYAGVSYYKEEIDALFSQAGDEEVMCAYYLSYYGFSNCSDYFAYYGYVFTPSPIGLLESNQVNGDYTGWSAYVDLSYAVNDQWEVGFGGRYTYDEKKFAFQTMPIESELGPFWAMGFTTAAPLVQTKDWSDFTPRLIVRYRPDDVWMFFASVTKGYKSGGFGSFAIEPDVPWGTLDVEPGTAYPSSFEPEEVWSYEVGMKGELFDGRMRMDMNAYTYNYKDLQVTVPGTGGGIIVDNVGEVDGWGVEGSMQMIISDNLDLFLSAAWADSEVAKAQALCDDTDDCEGKALPQVPEFSYSAVLRGELPSANGSWIGSIELVGQTKTYGGLLGLKEAENDGYIDMAVRAGYRSQDGWSAVAYVENVTDEIYYDGSAEGSGILPAHYFGISRPRTMGMKVSWEF